MKQIINTSLALAFTVTALPAHAAPRGHREAESAPIIAVSEGGCLEYPGRPPRRGFCCPPPYHPLPEIRPDRQCLQLPSGLQPGAPEGSSLAARYRPISQGVGTRG